MYLSTKYSCPALDWTGSRIWIGNLDRESDFLPLFTSPVYRYAVNRAHRQGFMQDENVACHDIGKLSFERAVGCSGTPQLECATCFAMPQLERATCFAMPQLERATCFAMPQLERATCFAMPQLERATRFPNVPSRACDSLSNVPIRTRMIASSKSVYSAVFFYNNYYLLSQYAFHVHVLIVLIKAWFSQHVAFIR